MVSITTGWITIHANFYNIVFVLEKNIELVVILISAQGLYIHSYPGFLHFVRICTKKYCVSIDIQTSTRDRNHPVFRAGSLLPEVIITLKISYRRLVCTLVTTSYKIHS